MSLMKLKRKDYDSFKNEVPYKDDTAINYIRKEHQGYYSVLTDNGNNDVTMLNDTVMLIAEYCNGIRSVDDIFIKLISDFNEVDEAILKKDLINTLSDLSKLNIVKWKGKDNKRMNNPLFENSSIEFVNGITFALANEQDISAIYNYFTEYFSNKENIFNDDYYNYYLGTNPRDLTSKVYIRQCLYSYYRDFFILKNNSEIIGLYVISPVVEAYLNSANIEFMSIPKKYLQDSLLHIINFYKTLPNKKINNIQLNIPNKIINNNSGIESDLEKAGYVQYGILKNNYLNKDDMKLFNFHISMN